MFAKDCFLHGNDNICYNKINVKEALILIVLLFQVAETLLKDENEVVLYVGYAFAERRVHEIKKRINYCNRY